MSILLSLIPSLALVIARSLSRSRARGYCSASRRAGRIDIYLRRWSLHASPTRIYLQLHASGTRKQPGPTSASSPLPSCRIPDHPRGATESGKVWPPRQSDGAAGSPGPGHEPQRAGTDATQEAGLRDARTQGDIAEASIVAPTSAEREATALGHRWTRSKQPSNK